jgi:hypothetical protein
VERARASSAARRSWFGTLRPLLAVAAVLGALGAASASATIAQRLGAGRVALTTSSAAPLFDLHTMTPGGRWRNALTIRNTGTLDVSWQLHATTHGDRAFLGRLELTVFEVRKGKRRCVFAGPLGSLRSVKLDVVAARDARTFTFLVQWPQYRPSSPPITTSGTARVDFSWTATSI